MAVDADAEKTYLINDVAQTVGLSQKRIREYEKEGLVKPMREPRTNNRIYVDANIAQIRRVKELIHEHGFTVSCLKLFIASVPCWVTFNCPEKETCVAYHSPHTPCYEVADNVSTRHENNGCESCPVYLNRDVPRMALLEKG